MKALKALRGVNAVRKPAAKAGPGPASMVRVKVCGITTLADAQAAIAAGADALGFNFYRKSPRYIAPKAAAAIAAALPPFVGKVAVFVDPSEAEVVAALMSARYSALQFHGDEDPGFLAAFPWDLQVKALRLRGPRDLALVLAYPRCAALLIDAAVPGAYGGTGKTASWDLAAKLARQRPLILAGGLTPANVAEAVRRVRPYAVDVASGVEKAPGKKDPAKMRAFVQAAKFALVQGRR